MKQEEERPLSKIHNLSQQQTKVYPGKNISRKLNIIWKGGRYLDLLLYFTPL